MIRTLLPILRGASEKEVKGLQAQPDRTNAETCEAVDFTASQKKVKLDQSVTLGF